MLNLYDITNKFEYRHGDIFEQNDLDYIAHQCNCFHCMGGGIAYQIAKRFPNVRQADIDLTLYANKLKMGTNLVVGVTPNNPDNKLKGIINMYSQYEPGCFKSDEEYDERLEAIENCLVGIKTRFENDSDVTIGFPYLIGCGISGLNEEDVIKIFNKVFDANSNSNIKIIFVDVNKTFDLYEQQEFDWNDERNDTQIESNSDF